MTTILVLAFCAFIAWHFIPKQTPRADPGFRRDPRIGVDNPDWRAAVEEHCESPAESAFLKAMIEAHQLQPRDGSLHGSGLQLDLQVKQSNYRVDFLVNGWLVVEIDGAAWHSSPVQQSRDAVRDEHFTGLGYAVIRIPAKTVFQRPDDAMRAVKARLQLGKPQLSEPVQQGGLERLAGTMRGISAGISEFNDSLFRARSIQEAMTAPKATFESERKVLEVAMETAALKVSIDERLKTPEMRQVFEETKKRLEDHLAQRASVSQNPSVKPSITVTEMVRPATHGDPETDGLIQASFNSLLNEREKMYAEARLKFQQDPRLRPIAMRKLIDLKCVMVAERLHGKGRPQLRKIDRTSEWHEILIYGSIQPSIYDLLINSKEAIPPE